MKSLKDETAKKVKKNTQVKYTRIKTNYTFRGVTEGRISESMFIHYADWVDGNQEKMHTGDCSKY